MSRPKKKGTRIGHATKQTWTKETAPKSPGRPRGVPNKVTLETRDLLAALVEKSDAKEGRALFDEWIEKAREEIRQVGSDPIFDHEGNQIGTRAYALSIPRFTLLMGYMKGTPKQTMEFSGALNVQPIVQVVSREQHAKLIERQLAKASEAKALVIAAAVALTESESDETNGDQGDD